MIKKKFSLVEILVVISIMIVLFAFIIPATTSYLQKVRAKNCQLLIQQISIAIKNYNKDFSTYFPVTIAISADYTLSQTQRQELFIKLTGTNSLNRNYLPDIQLEDNEINTPWGGNYEIAVNVGRGTLDLSHGKLNILAAITDVNCLAIISSYGVIREDFLIYTITPKGNLSNLHSSFSGNASTFTTGCLHSLESSF